MEIKDIVKGKRVKVVADSHNLIPIGATGTLLESNDNAPYVGFDKLHRGCFEMDDYENVRSMCCSELEEIE